MNYEPIIKTERIDDIPLLYSQIERMGIPQLIDQYFPTHGNWQGLSLGGVLAVWLCHILSQHEHRLSYVQPWVGQRLEALGIITKESIRELDFSDDRLEAALRYLSQDEKWSEFESALGGNLVQVYELNAEKVRLDSTTASSYCGVTEDGLFQFGKSKDSRPDLRQTKIMLSSLDPLGMPIATEIVSGNQADDNLYIPAVRRVKDTLPKSELLIIGDCKMAALDTRAEIVRGSDYYLCPLSLKQVSRDELKEYLLPVWVGEQSVTNIEYSYEDGKTEIVAVGYELWVNQFTTNVNWNERRLIVRSLKAAQSSEMALRERLQKATEALNQLGERSRGKKVLRTMEDWHNATAEIIKRYRVAGLLQLDYQVETRTTQKRKYGNRPASLEETNLIFLNVSVNETAVSEAIDLMGWRVYATNRSSDVFPLTEAVVTYRDSYLIERSFARLKNVPLSLTPIYLQRDDHIKGLIRLLSIGLRVMTLLEWVVRCNLEQQHQSLKGLYPGNPQRTTSRPTAEKLLAAFQDITVVTIESDGIISVRLLPLNPTQEDILLLLDFSTEIYTQLSSGKRSHARRAFRALPP
jgi:transposase